MGSSSPSALARTDSPAPSSLMPLGRVLVIGCHGDERDFLGEVLRDRGFAVDSIQAPNARLYENVALARDADVIVIDVGCDHDPTLLVTRIKSLNRRAKVVLCSDGMSAARLARGLCAGALGVIMKPFDPRQLAGIVRMAMETTARNDD
jgi:DNA-binding response OmpR family regulator